MSVATLNGTTAVSVRLVVPYRGAWFADVDLDPLIVAAVPTSAIPAILTIGIPPGPVTVMRGTIDPLASGSFVSTVRVRVVGGGNGWGKNVRAQHFHSPAGLLTPLVYVPTGLEVGEVVTVLVPGILGPDFVRSAGPASRVLDGEEWFVDFLGITQVGLRIPAIPDLSLEILAWDPLQKRAEFACDAVVQPGTPLIDPLRIGDGIPIVRDVEQTFDAKGSRGYAWTSDNAVTRLGDVLKTAVREFAKTHALKLYLYRVVLEPTSSTVALQAVHPTAGYPDLIPIDKWTGASGVTAKLLPSSQVIVGFLEGNPAKPVAISYEGDLIPLEVDIDAALAVKIGSTAISVILGGGLLPVARVGDPVTVTVNVPSTPFSGPAVGTISGGGNPRVLA